MKKGLSICLLLITLYNAGGYLLAFQYFIYRANKFNEAQISKDRYKESELVEIKIPVHLPGIESWRGYEAVNGSVQLAENSYNYVRMKMTADTIYVMCIPNYKTTRLLKENMIYARQVSDAPFNSKKQIPQVKSVKIVEHLNNVGIQLAPPQHHLVMIYYSLPDVKLTTRFPDVAAQPPESFLS